MCFLCHSKTLQLELVGIENATLCILLIQNTEVYRDKLNMKKMGGKKSLPRLSGSLSTVLQGGAKQHLFVLFRAKGNLKGRGKIPVQARASVPVSDLAGNWLRRAQTAGIA